MIKHRLHHAWSRILIGGILVVLLISVIPTNANALTGATATQQERAQAYLDMKALQACFRWIPYRDTSLNDSFITPQHAVAGEWFSEKGKEVGIGGFESDSGNIKCSDSDWLKRTLSTFGWSDPKQALKDFGMVLSSDGDFANAGGKSNDWYNDNVGKVMQQHWGQTLDPPGDVTLYLVYQAALTRICGATPTTDRDIAGSKNGLILKLPDQTTGAIGDQLFSMRLEKGDKVTYRATSRSADPQDHATCEELGKKMEGLASSVSTAIQNGIKIDSSGTGSDKESRDLATAESTCSIGSLGWIVCPVVTFLTDLNAKAFGFLSSSMLEVPSSMFDTSKPDSPGQPLAKAWGTFRNVANVLFVIAFLAIIYSQLSSRGIDNYSIKKMLPRLFVAAVLINFSYILCGLAVDIANILGHNLFQFMTNLSIGSVDASTSASSQWTGIGEGILTAGTTIGLVVLIILAPSVLIAVALVVLALVARQALVILLIAIAPIAFAAYLLPGTEDWFKKWYKAFLTLLMLFPIISIVFGGATLASNILSSVATTAGSGGKPDTMMKLAAAGTLGIPLFGIPMLISAAFKGLGTIGAKIGGAAGSASGRVSGGMKQARGRTSGKAKEMYGNSAFAQGRKNRKELKRKFRQNQLASAMTHPENASAYQRMRARMSRGVVGTGITKSGEYAQAQSKAAAVATYHKATNEAIDDEGSLLSELGGDKLLEIAKDRSVPFERRVAAFRRLEHVGGDQHIQAAYDFLSREGAKKGTADYDSSIGDIQQLSASSLHSRKPSGVSTTQSKALTNGTLGLNFDGETPDPIAGGGYKNMLKKRVQEGAFGAKDYANMTKDDLIRLAEMSKDNQLNDDEIEGIMNQFAAVQGDETLKGTMTEERQALVESILDRGGPRKADTGDGQVRYHKLTPL